MYNLPLQHVSAYDESKSEPTHEKNGTHSEEPGDHEMFPARATLVGRGRAHTIDDLQTTNALAATISLTCMESM